MLIFQKLKKCKLIKLKFIFTLVQALIVNQSKGYRLEMGVGNGAKKMQLEEAEGGEYRSAPGIYFLEKASQGMTNPKAVG